MLFLQFVFVLKVVALDVKSTDTIFDNGLIKSDEIRYAENNTIIIAPIFSSSNTSVSNIKQLKGLFYYLTVRLGYADMPFHYVVFKNGDVFRTSSVSDEQFVTVDNGEMKPIIIVYLADKGTRDFSDKAKNSIQKLTLEIANNNNISPDNLYLKNIRAVLNLDTKIAKLETKEIGGGWVDSFLSIHQYVDSNYSPKKKTYNIQVVGVKTPSDLVSPQETVIAEITLKNTGKYNIYGNGDSALLASKKDGKLSKFYIPTIWDSLSQVSFMGEDDILKVGDEQTCQVKLKVPLFFGQQTEHFVLKNVAGDTIEGTDFDITLNVKEIDEKVIEILPTEIGYLNVRSADSGHSDVIGRVTPGERYIEKQRGTNGYVQIQFTEDKLGWVFSKYTKRVN